MTVTAPRPSISPPLGLHNLPSIDASIFPSLPPCNFACPPLFPPITHPTLYLRETQGTLYRSLTGGGHPFFDPSSQGLNEKDTLDRSILTCSQRAGSIWKFRGQPWHESDLDNGTAPPSSTPPNMGVNILPELGIGTFTKSSQIIHLRYPHFRSSNSHPRHSLLVSASNKN